MSSDHRRPFDRLRRRAEPEDAILKQLTVLELAVGELSQRVEEESRTVSETVRQNMEEVRSQLHETKAELHESQATLHDRVHAMERAFELTAEELRVQIARMRDMLAAAQTRLDEQQEAFGTWHAGAEQLSQAMQELSQAMRELIDRRSFRRLERAQEQITVEHSLIAQRLIDAGQRFVERIENLAPVAAASPEQASGSNEALLVRIRRLAEGLHAMQAEALELEQRLAAHDPGEPDQTTT